MIQLPISDFSEALKIGENMVEGYVRHRSAYRMKGPIDRAIGGIMVSPLFESLGVDHLEREKSEERSEK